MVDIVEKMVKPDTQAMGNRGLKPVKDGRSALHPFLMQKGTDIIRLNAMGYSQTEIAEILNVNQSSISRMLAKPIAQELLKDIITENQRDEIRQKERIRVLRNKALDTYDEVLNERDRDGNPIKVRLGQKIGVANTVMLELSGLRVPTKIEQKTMSMSKDDIQEFLKRGMQQAESSAKVIDAEVIEEGK